MRRILYIALVQVKLSLGKNKSVEGGVFRTKITTTHSSNNNLSLKSPWTLQEDCQFNCFSKQKVHLSVQLSDADVNINFNAMIRGVGLHIQARWSLTIPGLHRPKNCRGNIKLFDVSESQGIIF